MREREGVPNNTTGKAFNSSLTGTYCTNNVTFVKMQSIDQYVG
jgi:hypothetical protein